MVADTAGKWPFIEDVTSDFIYVRLHGDKELYVSGYTEAALKEWARKIRAWAKGGNPRCTRRIGPAASPAKGGRDVFVYFDNDVKVRAPYDAMALAHRLGARSRTCVSENYLLSEVTTSLTLLFAVASRHLCSIVGANRFL